MTSLDDSIISRQNLMLLDNVTNYNKPAIDYFHHDFNGDLLELPLSWTLLLKMRKHKLLRLPSCSIEDDFDYYVYLVRLHHCLWRRWSIRYYGLSKLKIDPLQINWNKETDITVLYGPDFSDCRSSFDTEPSYRAAAQVPNFVSTSGKQQQQQQQFDVSSPSSDEEYSDSSLGAIASRNSSNSSTDSSSASYIFDRPSCIRKLPTQNDRSNQPLRFKNIVVERDINTEGVFCEYNICINDIPNSRKISQFMLRSTKYNPSIVYSTSFEYYGRNEKRPKSVNQQHQHQHHHHHHHSHHRDSTDESGSVSKHQHSHRHQGERVGRGDSGVVAGSDIGSTTRACTEEEFENNTSLSFQRGFIQQLCEI